MKLPSEFPEGPAEVIVIAALPTTLDARSARRAAIGRYEGKGIHLAEDFNAPLPDEVLDGFEGAADVEHKP
ncbi:MAG TPA: hypothetical protein VF331_16865 [Polyangiales bacterium]